MTHFLLKNNKTFKIGLSIKMRMLVLESNTSSRIIDKILTYLIHNDSIV